MPTFREDVKIGAKVPMMKTDDYNDQSVTKDKIRDGNITSEKLADGAVSTDKLPDGAIKTPKIADKNITTSKLAEASVVTSKIADQNVTKEKIADQSVDNSKLSPEAVTYDKLKDKSVITEKLNDRAVTTEKIEENAITNTKLGDQSVDGRVVREASIEGKHLGNNAVSTPKIASRSVTNEKIAHDSVSRAELTPDVRNSIDKKADAEQVNNSLYNLEKKIGDRFVVEGDVTNLPDEEDLTSVKESDRDVLKLADRSYAPHNFSGKGYKILRKNIKSVSIAVTKIRVESVPLSDGTLSFAINGKETHISVSASTDNTTALVAQKVVSALQESMTEYDVSTDASLITLTRKSDGSVTPSVFSASTTGVVCTVTDSTKNEFRNILTEVMINQPNTIYEIRYDFDLNGETINILENCTLKFEGGSLSNGMINSNKTKINSSTTSIFKNLNISGSLNASELFAEWFGVNVQNEDNAAFLNYAITTCIKTKIRRLKIGVGIFKINSIVYLGTPETEGWNIIIQGSGNNDSGFGTTFKIGENAFFYGNMENYKYGAQRAGAIFDCTFAGESKKGIGILLDYSQTYSIERCSFFNLNSGIAITGSCYYTYIKSCIFQSNEVAIHNLENSHKFYKEGQANDNIITGCFFSYNTNPVIISEGTGWHLSDSDIEGFNGTLILGNQNVATNVRIERNIYSLPWVEIGSKCVCSFQIHASGQDIQNWRCIAHGNYNDIKIICGDNINQLLRSDGVGNKFDIVALSDNANILCSPEDTLIVNGYSNKENIKGCNLLSYLDLSLKESDYIEYEGRKIAPIKNSFVNVSLHKSVKSQDGYRYLTAKSYIASSKDEEQLLFPMLYAYCKTNKWYQFVNIERQENISIERLIDNVNNINTYLLDVCIGTKPLYNRPVMKYYDGENAKSLAHQYLEVSVPNNVIKTKICDVSLEDTIYTNKLNKAYKAEGDKIVVGDEFYVEYGAAETAPMGGRKYAIITFFDDLGKKLIAEFRRGTTTVYPEYRILYTNGPTISALNKFGVVELTGFVGDIKNWIEYPIKYNRKYYPTVRYSESNDDILPTLSSIDAGYIVFDNKANKNILWNGTAWVNMDGTALS